MAHALVGAGGPCKVALLVKNLTPSGGNRVILHLFDALQRLPGVEVHVLVVPEARRGIRDVWNLIACKRRYGAAASVRRLSRPADPGAFDLLISTSRRTLDFVADLSHSAHVHLFQAVEAWDSENSGAFLEHCRDERYPDGRETIDLVRRIGIARDVRYVDQIASTQRFLAVSGYLADAARHAGGPSEVTVRVPPLTLRGAGGGTERDIDVLLFLRGFVYNGDDVTSALAHELADTRLRVAVVAGNYCRAAQVRALGRRERLTILREPQDGALAALYASARAVVHPSLSNGGGFIPFEALSFGCAVVASRTGWLASAEGGGPLSIMDRHDLNAYLGALMRSLPEPQ